MNKVVVVVVRSRDPAECNTFIITKCPRYMFSYNIKTHPKWFEVKLKTVDKDRNELNRMNAMIFLS